MKEVVVCGSVRLLQAAGGNTSEELLKEIGNYAIKNGLARYDYVEGLLKRESVFPTGISSKTGIAIPHADIEYTVKGTILVILLDKPTKFNNMCGEDIVNAEVVFTLLVSEAENQVKALSGIINFIQDENKLKALKTEDAAKIIKTEFENYAS